MTLKNNNYSTFFEDFSFSKDIKVILKNETESTNLDAKILAEQETQNTLIVALKQTDGKGRIGRSFFSPNGTGIYMSLLLFHDISAEKTTFMTSLAAVAVAKAVEKANKTKAHIKWVNDIYQNDRKISGILCSSAFGSKEKASYTIIGIGINLNTPQNGFPKEIENSAGSVFGTESITATQRTTLINDIVNGIFEYLDTDIKAHLSEYKERSYLSGKTVSFEKDGQSITAKVLGIDDDCRLLLKAEDGKEFALFAGEVSVKPNR